MTHFLVLSHQDYTGASADYNVDETITQTVAGGTAKGTVVSWTLDSGSTTAGVLKYIQTNDAHTDGGVVRAFENASQTLVQLLVLDLLLLVRFKTMLEHYLV